MTTNPEDPSPSTRVIEIDRLRERPDNANRMPERSFRALVKHIARTGRYPSIIVRPVRAGGSNDISKDIDPRHIDSNELESDEDAAGRWYEILDGHHRVRALRELNETQARCEVWDDVDDAEALVLLTTLNRLEGSDDPVRRGALGQRLVERFGRDRVGTRLPEDAAALDRLLETQLPPPAPAFVDVAEALPEAVTFFLTRAQRERLDVQLRRAADHAETKPRTRSERLIALLDLDGDSDENDSD